MKRLAVILLSAVLLLCSCTQKIECELFAMDTYMHLAVYGGSEEMLDDAKALISQIDARFSVNGESGEIAMLIKNGRIENPSAGLLEMLECARLLYERTNGAYDVTSLALSRLWEACEKEGREPTEAEINGALALVGMSRISFDENAVVLNGVLGVDLGSVAKGYAGRETAKLLEKSGAKGGILTLGGNVAVFGKKSNGEPFKIGITDPNNPANICGYVEIEKGNVITSGKYNRNFTIGDKVLHHIIDARTGVPCDNGVASVTVICDDGMWADALSTALLLLGEQGAIDYYNTYGGFEAVIVMDDGRIVTTSDALAFYTLEN